MTNVKWNSVSKFYWFDVVDYESNRSICSGYCNGYCRCTVVNPVINSIDYKNIYLNITGKKDITINSIKEYCLDRVIRSSASVNNFNIYGIKGYYGEEVEISYEGNLQDHIDFLSNNIDDKCIEYALSLEYGYVLEDLQNKSWRIETVNIKDVKTQNYKHINVEIVNEYNKEIKNDFDVYLLAIKNSENYYRLIDGYHRYSSMNFMKKENVKIICCDK